MEHTESTPIEATSAPAEVVAPLTPHPLNSSFAAARSAGARSTRERAPHVRHQGARELLRRAARRRQEASRA